MHCAGTPGDRWTVGVDHECIVQELLGNLATWMAPNSEQIHLSGQQPEGVKGGAAQGPKDLVQAKLREGMESLRDLQEHAHSRAFEATPLLAAKVLLQS